MPDAAMQNWNDYIANMTGVSIFNTAYPGEQDLKVGKASKLTSVKSLACSSARSLT